MKGYKAVRMNGKAHKASVVQSWRDELALRWYFGWVKDPQLYAFGGLGVIICITWLSPTSSIISLSTLIVFMVISPVVEELFFRGIIQGKLLTLKWGRESLLAVTSANILTSLVFTAFHFVSHPPLWAFSVIIPSLVFGYIRERHDNILPAITLHVAYNAAYFM